MSTPGRPPRQPQTPGRCDGCGGPIPPQEQTDERLVRTGNHLRLCSMRCRNRLEHRRQQRKWTPEVTRQAECGRKQKFRSRELAERAIARHAQDADYAESHSYQCPWCGHWHIGRYTTG